MVKLLLRKHKQSLLKAKNGFKIKLLASKVMESLTKLKMLLAKVLHGYQTNLKVLLMQLLEVLLSMMLRKMPKKVKNGLKKKLVSLRKLPSLIMNLLTTLQTRMKRKKQSLTTMPSLKEKRNMEDLG